MGALASALPRLAQLSFKLSFKLFSDQSTLPCNVLVEVVERMPGLQHLQLAAKVSSAAHVVQAALAAQQQARAGRRTQPLVIGLMKVRGFAERVPGGAQAVNAQLQPLLAQGLWGPPMVQVCEE